MSIENEEINRSGILEQFENQSTTAKIAEGAAVVIATAAAAYLTHGKSLSMGFQLGAKYEKAGMGAAEFAEASKVGMLNAHSEIKLLSSSRNLELGGQQLKFGEPKSTLSFLPAAEPSSSFVHLSEATSRSGNSTLTTGLTHDLEPTKLPFKAQIMPAESHTLDFAPPQRISLDGAEAISRPNLHNVENLERQAATPSREIAAVDQSLGAKPMGFIKLGALSLAGVGALALAGCDDEKKDCDKNNSNDCSTGHASGGGYVARPGYTGGGYSGYSGSGYRGTTESESLPRAGVAGEAGEAVGARGGVAVGEGAHGAGSFGGVAGEGG